MKCEKYTQPMPVFLVRWLSIYMPNRSSINSIEFKLFVDSKRSKEIFYVYNCVTSNAHGNSILTYEFTNM